MIKLTKEDNNKLNQILKELNETRNIIKERIYVNPSNAPKGAKLQRGPKGGTYYESGEKSNVKSPQKISKPTSQLNQTSLQGKKIADWAEKKYGKDALYMLEQTHEGTEVYGNDLINNAINYLKQKYQKPSPGGKSVVSDSVLEDVLEDYVNNGLPPEYVSESKYLKDTAKKYNVPIKRLINLLPEDMELSQEIHSLLTE